ncbi:MAG: hypothetical protein KatS3mg095_0303 [Candidatus Parcubacteria bacterium]|nr:MAG: hypothetical protein KatS3mg095_0303 [Candidatus Parcubacteria bacterium]
MIKETLLIIKKNLIEYYQVLKFIVVDNYDKVVEIIIFYFLLTILYFLLKFLVFKIIKISLIIKKSKHQLNEKDIERIDTLSSVFRSVLKILFVFTFLLFILKTFNIKIIPIITGAGVLGAAFIFSFQDIIKDIIKGWLLIFEDQARKGEWVNINNSFIGKVIEFNLRYIVLIDRERNYIYIHNNQINSIINLNRSDKKFFIGIRFNKDVNLDSEVDKINDFIEKNKNKYSKIYDFKLEEKFNITPEYYEIFISFKTKFSLGEYYIGKIKIDLIKKFKENLREIV